MHIEHRSAALIMAESIPEDPPIPACLTPGTILSLCPRPPPIALSTPHDFQLRLVAPPYLLTPCSVFFDIQLSDIRCSPI